MTAKRTAPKSTPKSIIVEFIRADINFHEAGKRYLNSGFQDTQAKEEAKKAMELSIKYANQLMASQPDPASATSDFALLCKLPELQKNVARIEHTVKASEKDKQLLIATSCCKTGIKEAFNFRSAFMSEAAQNKELRQLLRRHQLIKKVDKIVQETASLPLFDSLSVQEEATKGIKIMLDPEVIPLLPAEVQASMGNGTPDEEFNEFMVEFLVAMIGPTLAVEMERNKAAVNAAIARFKPQ